MSFPPGTEMFQFPGFASRPYGFRPGYPKGVGFPIRTSADQRSLASPRGLSQRATSFIAFWRQGIHRTPLLCSTTPQASVSGDPDQRPHAGHVHPARPIGQAATLFTETLTLRGTRRRSHARQTPRTQHQIPIHHDKHRRTNPAQTLSGTARAGLPEACTRNQGRRRSSRLDHPGTGNLRHTGDGRIRTDDPLLAKQVLSH